jgi:hypothetical protein
MLIILRYFFYIKKKKIHPIRSVRGNNNVISFMASCKFLCFYYYYYYYHYRGVVSRALWIEGIRNGGF